MTCYHTPIGLRDLLSYTTRMGVVKATGHSLPPGTFPTTWQGDFTFIQAADCQFGMEWSVQYFGDHDTLHKLYADNCVWDYEEKWSTAFVKQINSMPEKPLFAVMCGDMLDAWPDRYPQVRERQKVSFDRIMAHLNIPLVCVCGNHDVGNSPTPQTIGNYRSDFGDDWFSFVCGDVLFLVLNSQYYEDNTHVTEMSRDQDTWLTEQLASTSAYKHTVVFQHIPWFLSTPHEEKEYFNISQPLREGMLSKFHGSGVSKIFTGHYHKNAGGWYKDEMEVVVTSAVGSQLGTDKNGFRVVNVKENEITHKYVDIKLDDAS